MAQQMRRLGLIGGLAPVSTAEYYKRINEGVLAKIGGRHSAPLVIWSCDMHPIIDAEERGAWDEVGHELAKAASTLEAAGCEGAIICCNSVHTAFEHAQRAVQMPILHIADVTADAVTGLGCQKVALLSHKYAANEDSFFAKRLRARGLQVILDHDTERAELHRLIFEELMLGQVTDEAKKWFQGRVRYLIHGKGADIVVLACTELGLLTGGVCTIDGITLLDTLSIHADVAVAFITRDCCCECPPKRLKLEASTVHNLAEIRSLLGTDTNMSVLGKTSLMVAAERALETEKHDGALFNDPYARALAGTEGFELSERLGESCGQFGFEGWPDFHKVWTSVRTKFIDELLSVAYRGFQMVNLGAGVDTRPYRMENYQLFTSSFEVDTEEGDLQQKLREAKFDAQTKSVFLIEGVLDFLEKRASDLLQEISDIAAPGSIAIINYAIGPPRPGTFTLGEIDVILRGAGWIDLQSDSFGEPRLNYGLYKEGLAPNPEWAFVTCKKN